jgi:hypothetical protein
MPAAKRYFTDENSKEHRDQRETADREFQARRDLHKKNAEYYAGDHKRHLLPGQDNVDDNVTLNLTKRRVDRRVFFLFPDFPRLEITEDSKTDPNEEWLNGAWRAAGGASLMINMAVNGSIDGQVFARIAMLDGEEWPRVVALPGTNVIVWWDADDVDHHLWYELRWKAGKTERRQDIVRPSAMSDGLQNSALAGFEGWLIRDFVKEPGDRWKLETVTKHPYSDAPIVTWQHLPATGTFYGQHEFDNALINDAFNRTASNINRILRFHAHPITFVEGLVMPKEGEQTLDVGPNRMHRLSKDGKAFNLEMQSDLSSSMKFLEFLHDFYFDTAGITVMPTDVTAFSQVTNFGIKTAFMPMSNINDALRRNYGERGIAEISRRMQMFAGQQPKEVKLHWKNALPIDEREQVDIQQKEIDMGTLAVESAMQERGRDPEREREKMMNDSEFAQDQVMKRMIEVVSSGNGNRPEPAPAGTAPLPS